jgi:hypothetical protein
VRGPSDAASSYANMNWLCCCPAMASQGTGSLPESSQAYMIKVKRMMMAQVQVTITGLVVYWSHHLCRAGHWVTRLLVASGGDPNIPDELGRTPLHLAAAAGAHRLARELLKAGANPAAQDAQGQSPAGVAKVRKQRFAGWRELVPDGGS